jgi:replicative DNA helicase
LPSLDKEISHAFAPGLHGVYGNAGSGKTALSLQISSNCLFPALFITCEMSASELLRRHTARVTSTYLGRLKSGEMAPDAIEKLAREAIAAAPNLCLLDATLFPAPKSRILECAEVVRSRSESGQVLLVIDSLQSWAESFGGDAGAGEYETLNVGIKTLREIAHTLNAPVIFTSERNRKGNEKSSGGLNSGAGSRKIEYGAETVIDLDRDMEAQSDGAGEFSITLRLAKNRHGGIGRPIALRFNGALQRFREADGDQKRGK